MTGYVAVNLEGIRYDGWPVGRLIRRELLEPALFRHRAEVEQAYEVEVCWWRDA